MIRSKDRTMHLGEHTGTVDGGRQLQIGWAVSAGSIFRSDGPRLSAGSACF